MGQVDREQRAQGPHADRHLEPQEEPLGIDDTADIVGAQKDPQRVGEQEDAQDQREAVGARAHQRAEHAKPQDLERDRKEAREEDQHHPAQHKGVPRAVGRRPGREAAGGRPVVEGTREDHGAQSHRDVDPARQAHAAAIAQRGDENEAREQAADAGTHRVDPVERADLHGREIDPLHQRSGDEGQRHAHQDGGQSEGREGHEGRAREARGKRLEAVEDDAIEQPGAEHREDAHTQLRHAEGPQRRARREPVGEPSAGEAAETEPEQEGAHDQGGRHRIGPGEEPEHALPGRLVGERAEPRKAEGDRCHGERRARLALPARHRCQQRRHQCPPSNIHPQACAIRHADPTRLPLKCRG